MMQKKRSLKFEKKISQDKIYNFVISLNKKLIKYNKQAEQYIYSFKSKNKTVIDPVTKFDIKIEKIIRNEINKNFFNHNIVGEEEESQIKNSDYSWFIDPIDGTKSLILGFPNWSNLIGLYYKNECIFSFANFPILKETYITKDDKVYCIKNNSYNLISSNKIFKKKNIKLVINTFHTLKNKKIFNFVKKFEGMFKVSGVDAYNFCKVADGKIDVLIESGLKKVDIFPIIRIVKNSGAIITDWNGKQEFKNGDVLVSSNKKIHRFFLKKLN